ncbi:unnamed protein product [Tilletia controversa]|uniref:Exoribonuclease phosphorolytic domain-containing protein n=3 Tax=Tilletia TaxID=13289 RepID=A0A8X7MPI1_9BASI|nr:hypothetical protein CF336_g7491 [Tilletia laevis]KAE8186826.1 hypothetical protein CF328_g7112 [Tilletia controversa]KAE8247004.1 hypothetical protein A4X03_0g7172 [Tilletia caries]KAE8188418.1 hypothetical protein CF335_g6901 [Tilletia laevis]KAE8243670.1 hypothetical protein A4X06_0g6160 [Tilletia controversa]
MASSADRRRVKGPEGSQPPVFASPAAVDERRRILRQKQSGAATDTDTDDAEATHVDEHAHRIERGVAPVCTGRGAHDLRPIYPELNVEVRLAPYALPRRARPGKDVESASLSALVTQALLPSIRLDLLPKATLDIFITVLEADALDEGCAAASATLASTALADAGVDLHTTLAADAGMEADQPSSKAKKQPTIYLDPTRAEASAAQANVTLCTMPALGTVTALYQGGGTLTWAQTEQGLDLLHEASSRIHYVVAQAISDRFLARQSTAGGAAAGGDQGDVQPYRLQ